MIQEILVREDCDCKVNFTPKPECPMCKGTGLCEVFVSMNRLKSELSIEEEE